uniref:NB-ARC domain-containing protein n=1 Tax=Oryza brachyantha TaxID=4533 RepID=J3LL77_ORYBR
MGGVGKTTLLRAINNCFLPARQSPASSKKFDHVIWAVASKECSIERLQNDVANKLGLPLANLPDEHSDADLEQRALPIAEHLKNTSFLILLDDLWECFDLKLIGVPYPDGAGSERRRKVVLTTRSEVVCGRMKADRVVNVECLKQDDAWTLFEMNATAATIASHAAIAGLAREVAGECRGLPLALITIGKALPAPATTAPPAAIAGLAREVAGECRGLPLALITIGKALSTKTDPELWRHAIDKLRDAHLHEITGMEEENSGMLRVLKLSYDYLPTTVMQECFLTCCLWPEDSPIEREKLVECWLGLGLIAGSGSVDDDVETATRIITALKDVRLLESGGDGGDTQGIRMHDMIRDMSIWIASGCGATRNKWLGRAGAGPRPASKLTERCRLSPAGSTERVSLMKNLIEELPARLPARPGVRVLMLQTNTSLHAIPGSFLRCVPALTYLDLSDTIIMSLPGEIGSLVGLRYLNAAGTYINALPPDLVHLTQLEHLLLSDTNMLDSIPRGVILGLQKLKVLDVYASKYTGWRLNADDAGEGGEDSAAADASLDELESRNASIKFLGINVSSVAALRKLSSFANVSTRRLCLKDMAGPASLNLLPSTLSDVLGGLDMLETLQHLAIRSCAGVKDIVVDAAGANSDDDLCRAYRLPKLERLRLLRLRHLETVRFHHTTAAHVFPALRRINILNCFELKNANWVLHLPVLEYLELHYCHNMVAIVDGGGEAAADRRAPTFPCLRTLAVHGMRSLGCLCRGVPAASFPALEILEVGHCYALRRLDGVRPLKLREIQGSDEWWQQLEWEDDGIKDALFPYFKNHS